MAKVLIFSPNAIGKSMAGASIRAVEFAKALSDEHDVITISKDTPGYKEHFKNADVLIAQRLTFPLALLVKKHGLKVIIDAYTPGPLELLEHFKDAPLKKRSEKVDAEITNLHFSFKMANGILCATERQKDLWAGFLLGQKWVDLSLKNLFAIVPFGLSSTPPKKNGKGLREIFGFSTEDKVLLWGGGIWNWFDPLTLIKAMKIVSQARKEIKLVFMGVTPPDPKLPRTSRAQDAVRLAEELNLIGRSVFFNFEWVPYEERVNFLLDADMGVSTHFNHLETRFSYRTRMLDYIWAGLPMIATEGDAFAEIIAKNELGLVVPYQDEQALALAILSLVDNCQKITPRVLAMRERFYWDHVTRPLKKMIHGLSDQHQKIKCSTLLHFFISKLRERGLKACLARGFRK